MSRVFKKGKYWYIDYVANGRRKREKVSKYKKLARFKLNEIELQIERGELRIPTDITVDEFFEKYLNYVRVHSSPKTLERYETVIKAFERFRSKRKSVNKLTKITHPFLEEFKLERVRFVSKSTVNHDLKVLTTAFNWAIRKNYLARNPVIDVERFRVKKKQVRFFSKAEISLILSYCPEKMFPVYMILLHTGIRRGELAKLEWKRDIDFERRVIKIQPKDDWAPKGKKGREIPISDELLDVLVKLRTESRGRSVVEEANKNRYPKTLWENFKRLLKRLGIEDANIHTFRHYFASQLIMNGVDIVTVKELLGHSDIQTTMKYAHLTPGHKQWAVNTLCSDIRVGTMLAPTKDLVN